MRKNCDLTKNSHSGLKKVKHKKKVIKLLGKSHNFIKIKSWNDENFFSILLGKKVLILWE